MILTSVHKGHATTTVTFANADDAPAGGLFAAALRATGETRSSLFGHTVERHDNGAATVRLHTD
jgi:hypothetical protein